MAANWNWISGLWLVALMACAPDGGAGTCEAYIGCIAVVEPGALGDVAGAFGEDGTCWDNDSLDCEQLCEVGLDALHEVNPECAGVDLGSSPMPQEDFDEAFRQKSCDEYRDCNGGECFESTSDGGSEGCDYNADAAWDCLNDPWECNRDIPDFAYPVPPESCADVYANCPTETETDTTETDTDTTDVSTCSCTVNLSAFIGQALAMECETDPELCRGDLVGGVWDADVEPGPQYVDNALAWSTLPDFDLGEATVALLPCGDIPCGQVTGYVFLDRDGDELVGPDDVVDPFAAFEIWECEDGGSVHLGFFLTDAF